MESIKKIATNLWKNNICSSNLISPNKRYKLYQRVGMDIEKSRIRFGCTFDGENLPKIKQGVFINCNVYFDCNQTITIGENTFIGNKVSFITTTHEVGSQNMRAGTTVYLPIDIGKGCWIGANSTILPNVKVGNGCIIAAGSIVNKDCEPNGLYAGVPAKRIKELPINN